MFVSTYSFIQSVYNLKTQCIGVYQSEIDAIKGTINFLILEDCIWCGVIDSLTSYIDDIEIDLLDNGCTIDELDDKMSVELYNWFKLSSTQEKVKNDSIEEIAFELSSIIANYVTTIEEAYRYIEKCQNTYLRIEWAFSIEEINDNK